jgi:uncharacterized short protein YbdD (DUF466 family)
MKREYEFSLKTIDRDTRVVIFRDVDMLNEKEMRLLLNYMKDYGKHNRFILEAHYVENIISSIRNKCCEIGFAINNQTRKDIEKHIKDNVELEADQINLKEIYLNNKEEYHKWLNNEFPNDRSRDTKNRHKTMADFIFLNKEINIATGNDFEIYFRRLTKKEDNRSNVTFRNFVKFCIDKKYVSKRDGREILRDISGGLKRKGREEKRINDEEMIEFINNVEKYFSNPNHKRRKLKKYNPELFILFTKLSIESGARIISIKEDMFANFDINNLEQIGEVSRYKFNKEKTNDYDNKDALYLFCRTKTINKILEYYNEGQIVSDFFNTFEDNVIDWLREDLKVEPVLFKFHRKYLKTICYKSKIPKHFVEFFSSRISNLDIGDLNYDDLERFSFDEYQKAIPELNKLLDKNGNM